MLLMLFGHDFNMLFSLQDNLIVWSWNYNTDDHVIRTNGKPTGHRI